MLADHPDLDTLIVPIGGGGLISGIAVAAKALKPDIEIIGVQSALYPVDAPTCCRARRPATAGGGATLAEGIAVKEPGMLTRRIVAALVADILLVDDAQIEARSSMLHRPRRSWSSKAPAPPASRRCWPTPSGFAAGGSASSSPAAISTRGCSPRS